MGHAIAEPESMLLSKAQLDLVRAALRHYHFHGRGISGKKISWERIVSDIGIYTDYIVETDGEANDCQLADLNKNALKNAGENLRKFSMSPLPGAKRKQPDSPIALPYIVEFLLHPEIDSGLSADLLFQSDISLQGARYLSEFIWDGSTDQRKGISRLAGSYYANETSEDAGIVTHLQFHDTKSDLFSEVSEVRLSQYGSDILSVSEGWAVYTNKNHAIIFLKSIQSSSVEFVALPLASFHYGTSAYEIVTRGVRGGGLTSNGVRSVEDFIGLGMLPHLASSFLYTREIAQEQVDNTVIFQYVEDFYTAFDNRSGKLRDREQTRQEHEIGLFATSHPIHSRTLKSVSELSGIELNMELFASLKMADADRFGQVLAAGANANFQQPGTGSTALHVIATLGRRTELRMILRDSGLNFLQRDNKGRLPSFLAYRSGVDPVMVRYLAIRERRAGADVGITPYSFVAAPAPDA